MSSRYPSLQAVLQPQLTKTAAAPKTAGTVPDPGPDSGHPASVDSENMPVSEGPTITDSEKRNVAARGELSAEQAGEPIVDKPAVTIDTETGKDGDELRSEIPINDGVMDPGPDSGHPASVPTEKYASVNTPEEAFAAINEALSSLIAKVASMEVEKEAGQPAGDTSTPAKKDPLVKNADEVTESDDEPLTPVENKIASLLDEIVPDVPKKAGVPSMRQQMNAKLAESLAPYVAAGVDRGQRLADYIKLASADPAAAAMLMADPAMVTPGGEADMGGMPDMGGAPGGMPPGADGGASEEDQLIEAIMQIAAEQGISPEELLMKLESGDVADAGAPPAAAGSEPPMPEEEMTGPPPDAESDEGDEGEDPKTAAAPGAASKKDSGDEGPAKLNQAARKIANALLNEFGKTPQQIAEGVC